MDVKTIVKNLTVKYKTNNPFELAEASEIQIIEVPLKNTLGYYHKYARVRTIILNDSIPEYLRNFVCAHELGHALCHTNINTQKLKMYTLFSTDKIEREANTFAVELILQDNFIIEYPDTPIYELGRMLAIPEKLICLKKFTR